ncbi:unnamed protein product, partial [Vitis vinifera]|uniref:PH domain-containing protein n=1 Tax=Vitis vinifera TaxID=29760 RepID=D7TUW0_VITVI
MVVNKKLTDRSDISIKAENTDQFANKWIAALKVAAQTHGGRNEEIVALRMEAESARDEAISTLEQLHEAESEIKALRTMNQRMMLTQEEMEVVVLKRCWLARYWSLCVQYGKVILFYLFFNIFSGAFFFFSFIARLFHMTYKLVSSFSCL